MLKANAPPSGRWFGCGSAAPLLPHVQSHVLNPGEKEPESFIRGGPSAVYVGRMPLQLRRYELDPAHVDEWVVFFERLTPVRARFGFRLVCAYLDRENNEFTWIVEHDQPFADAEAIYNASPERAELFSGQPKFARAMHVSNVESFA